MVNLFGLPLRKRYYLTHPISFIKQISRNLSNARMRLKMGYCYYDVWDMDTWFLEVVPGMLRALADKGCAHPISFENREEWEKWLRDLADKFESASEKYQDKHNECYEDYINTITTNPIINKETARIKYTTRADELYKIGQNNLKEAFAAMAEHFYDLWD